MHHKVSQTHTKSCAYHEIGTNIAGQMYAENLYGGTKSHHISPLLDLQEANWVSETDMRIVKFHG